jgi:hypothetical protein
MRSGFLPYLIAIVLVAPAAAAPPTRAVGGQRLPVLDAEPDLDEGTFVAPAGSSLAQKYGASLLSTTLDDGERRDLKVDKLPSGLFVVRIHRDRSGKRYLYKPCDLGYHQRTLITETQVWMFGVEPMIVPIARKVQRGRITAIELDTTGLPPITSKLRLRSTSPAGHYDHATGDGGWDELFATPAAAAKLDVVVRVCKKAKVAELDFTK